MARTLAERWRESPLEQSLEQFLHLAAIGAPPVAIVLALESSPVLAGVLASAWVGSVREFVDGLPVESWGDALLDLAFVIAGGALAGLAFAVWS